MKKIVFILMLIVAVTANNALAADKNDLAKDLMKAIGFDSMLESIHQDTVNMVKGQMDSMLAQIRQANPNITDEVMKEFNAAAQDFSSRVMNSWNTAEAAKIYSSALVDGLSEKDIRAAIEHYRTTEGQKELKVISAAAQKMNGYIMSNIKKEIDAATKDYVSQLRSIVERYKNKRNKSQSETSK